VNRKFDHQNTSPIKKWLLILAGSLSVGLGVLGIVLPLLPTTPFLLLAAACYLRSSERLYNWLMNHRVFGKILRDYLHKRTISIRIKISSLTLMWLAISYSAIFVVSVLWVRVLLFAIAIGVTIHILSFKSRD
jgi:uncharacterized membrane protein YbaN (DUF454 family)